MKKKKHVRVRVIDLTADNLESTRDFINEFCCRNDITNSIVKWNESKTSQITSSHTAHDFCRIREDTNFLLLNFIHSGYSSMISIGCILKFYESHFEVIGQTHGIGANNSVTYYFPRFDNCPIPVKVDY